jgi:hypothetical protein
LNLRGRSTVCCCETGTTFTGIESNCEIVRTCSPILGIGTYTKALEEILCLGIYLQSILVLSEVEGRNFGDVLILSLTLLFLKLEGDTTDRTTLNTLHQMCCVTGNLIIGTVSFRPEHSCNIPSYLVAETLRGNDCNFIADSLVGLEIEGQLRVVSLNDDLGGLLDGLGTNATHDCGSEELSRLKLSM